MQRPSHGRPSPNVRSVADLHAVGFLFPELQKDARHLLPQDPSTVARLVALGRTMRDPQPASPDDPGNTDVPAAYTYFGQFVDHDITRDNRSATLPRLMDPNLVPMTPAAITSALHNERTGTLDLDSVYDWPAPRDPADRDRMALGRVSPVASNGVRLRRPLGKDDDNDLPRQGRSGDPNQDRAARIGDPRNDENVVISQLQVAFLKAHNELVRQGHDFDAARTILRQHYQHVVVHDFLPRVADPAIIHDIVDNGAKAYNPATRRLFMPLEFSVAAFRFGHSMIRNAYDYNVNFNFQAVPATLELLFAATAFSGELVGFDTLPESWIVEWERLIPADRRYDRARRIDTKLSEFLFDLRDIQGLPPLGDGARLAVRNLLRGYLLRMPTGQAVARALGLEPLTPTELEAAASSPPQVEALRSGGFVDRTPLWYYVLAEATLGGGQRLGPVGSTIVADVLVGLVRHSADSILGQPDWRPTLPSARPGTFELRDLLAFAGVLPVLRTFPQPRPVAAAGAGRRHTRPTERARPAGPAGPRPSTPWRPRATSGS